MPFTVITTKNVPPSLRGDLTKWTQEIATGVYIGNFNAKVREALWERVKQNAGKGEVTISYASRNELGYSFDTFNGNRWIADYDGISLVKNFTASSAWKNDDLKHGFSDAAKYRKIRKFSSKKMVQKKVQDYVVIDIETDGLNDEKNVVIEIGAVKVEKGSISKFHSLVSYDGLLPDDIINLTGITSGLLKDEGRSIEDVLSDFTAFIGDFIIVGYKVDFDIRFLNKALENCNMDKLNNKFYDILKYVKKEKQFLSNYKLKTVLVSYGIEVEHLHRALNDAILTYELTLKVNEFLEKIIQS